MNRDLFDRALALGITVYQRPLAEYEPCNHLQAEAWLVDDESLQAGGIKISPPPKGPISVSMDSCGGPAVCPIRTVRR